MKILFLSDNFPPEHNAPASRTFEHAQRWQADGHQVRVITTAPNFPEGKVHTGYLNKWRAASVFDGVPVLRVKSYITANEGFIRRTLDYLSFMASGGLAALFHARPAVLVTTSPQFFCAVAGWLVSRVRRLPWVFELRDIWPESIVQVGAMRRGRLIRWLEALELAMYRSADRIVVVSAAFKDNLIARGVPAERIHVVLNGVDRHLFTPQPPEATLVDELGLEGKFVVGYLGTFGMAHALHRVIDAAVLLRERTDIVFLLAGSGAHRDQIKALIEQHQLTNIRLLAAQPRAAMPALWSVQHLALVPLKRTEIFRTVIPSKIFEAMAMQVPLLLSIPEGEATSLVARTGTGVHVEPEEPAALVAAILRLKADPAARARMRKACARAAAVFSRDEQAKRMLRVLKLAARRSGEAAPSLATERAIGLSATPALRKAIPELAE